LVPVRYLLKLLKLEIYHCQKFDQKKLNKFVDIDLECLDSKIVNKAHNFGGAFDIIKSAQNKESCFGYSSIDTLHTDDCTGELKIKLQEQIKANCVKKSKCKVRIDKSDIDESCTNYLLLDIYMSYSCYGKLILFII
jgi:hypothetical protein